MSPHVRARQTRHQRHPTRPPPTLREPIALSAPTLLIFSRKLGEALALAGAYMDAAGILREALDMAGPSGQDRARVLGVLAHVAHGRERRQEAQAYLREALELANRAHASELVSSLEDLKRAIAS